MPETTTFTPCSVCGCGSSDTGPCGCNGTTITCYKASFTGITNNQSGMCLQFSDVSLTKSGGDGTTNCVYTGSLDMCDGIGVTVTLTITPDSTPLVYLDVTDRGGSGSYTSDTWDCTTTNTLSGSGPATGFCNWPSTVTISQPCDTPETYCGDCEVKPTAFTLEITGMPSGTKGIPCFCDLSSLNSTWTLSHDATDGCPAGCAYKSSSFTYCSDTYYWLWYFNGGWNLELRLQSDNSQNMTQFMYYSCCDCLSPVSGTGMEGGACASFTYSATVTITPA